jgi:hypothetical protein
VVCVHYRYARYHWDRYGHVSFRVDYGCLKHCCLWTRLNRRKEAYSEERGYRLTLII